MASGWLSDCSTKARDSTAFPKSAWTVGRPILEAYGVKATYYAAGRFRGKTEGGLRYFDVVDLAEIAAAGHEIGCHTWSHKPATGIASAEFVDDCARNREFLEDTLGHRSIPSFAYPYGDVGVRVKALAGRGYRTARGIEAGVNVSPLDLAQLKAMPLEQRSWTPGAMDLLAAEAARTEGWLILFTHDVSDAPSPFGCTPRMLETALAIGRRHGLEMKPVGLAAEQLLSPSPVVRPGLDMLPSVLDLKFAG